jgi:hypothetical protein
MKRRGRLKPATDILLKELLLVADHVIDGLLNVGDFLGLVVRNFALEFFFKRHHQFNGIQRIRAEVVNERRFVLDVSFINAKLFCNNLF